MSLTHTVKSLQDIMRKDAGVDGDAQRIGQLGWMLFFKIYSDLEAQAELDDDDFVSPVPAHLRWEAWADEESLGKDAPTGERLLALVDGQLFPTMKELDLDAMDDRTRQRGALLRSVFEDAYNYMKSGTLLRQVINKINDDIDFNESTTRHLFGEIYEKILRDLQGAGNSGEFYTPRAATQFAVKMIAPEPGETILDPACGTGGFLTAAYEHARQTVSTTEELAQLKRNVAGVEKKALPHLLCVTNMMIHGVEVPDRIRHGNTLARPLRDYGSDDQVDIIVTNPPFGGMEEDGIELNFPSEFRTRETADLFLVLVMELLKEGGRAAVILPDSTLFGDGIKARLKKRLLEECNLHTIVRLPKGVFAPYTDIKTNILFLTKGEPTQEIWYYEHPFPSGVSSYSKTKPMQLKEFGPEQAWWHAREENDHAWKVHVSDIVGSGYSLDVKNPNAQDLAHVDPVVLTREHRRAALQLTNTLNSLKGELKSALGPQALPSRQFIESFDVIAQAPGGVSRLREMIYDLAVRGQLVPQQPEEEEAGALLRSLAARAEAAAKPKRGRRRSTESTTTIAPVPPFPLPRGWEWAPFSKVAHIASHLVDPTESPGMPHVAPDSIEKATGRLLNYRTIQEDGVTSSKHRFFAGQILYSKIRPNLSKSVLVDFEGLCSADMYPIDSWIDARYLHAFILSPPFIKAVTRGDNRLAMPKVNQAQLSAVSVPVPPLGEQGRIVERLGQLMELCDELQTRKAHCDAVAEKLAVAATRVDAPPMTGGDDLADRARDEVPDSIAQLSLESASAS
ncbi:N-6 DNA methylase [Streptomyces sp. NPDC059002]|uniref:N-6 DNA methylase n=1 Tax=Streptomyces sp. NPDC059002 TaxID=3346690 RepID=UPI0036C00276